MQPGHDDAQEILSEFLAESTEQLEALDGQFVQLESDPTNTELLNAIFRVMHSLKGSAGFLGFPRLVEVAHHTETVMDRLRTHELVLTPAIADVILATVDLIKTLLIAIRQHGHEAEIQTATVVARLVSLHEAPGSHSASEPSSPSSPLIRAPLSPSPDPGPHNAEMATELARLLDQPTEPAPAAPLTTTESVSSPSPSLSSSRRRGQEFLTPTHGHPHTAPHPTPIASSGTGSAADEEQTLRVETKRLDHVMNLVGELVLGRNRLMKLVTTLEARYGTDADVKATEQTLAHLTLVTTDLQTAVMKTRMLPIKKVFTKFPRMVRDLATKTGKHVALRLVGEDTELDKSVIDELGSPLVHLIRNAIDHGIESPASRQQAGKPPTASVTIAARQEGNQIVIQVQDDGRGIAIEKIRERALARGLVTAQEVATWERAALLNLIFEPGFSTAEQVTDLSGRGVGMDVVRTNITKLNGTVALDTEEGAGTTVTITLPLTVAIIQALVVGVGGQRYAIPLASVLEAVKLGPTDSALVGGREMLSLRGRMLPLLRLSQTLGLNATRQALTGGSVVVVAAGERRVGLAVETLYTQEEVVIKTLTDSLGKISGIAGATLTGEGTVILILDIPDLLASVRNPAALRAPTTDLVCA